MIKNINDRWGDPITFAKAEDMGRAIEACGYQIPDGGLVEGSDYEVIELEDLTAEDLRQRVKSRP
jgi:hypothetical protein